MHILVINFYIAAPEKEIFIASFRNHSNNVVEASRDDALEVLIRRYTHHREGLTTTCLAVSEDSPVVALEDGVDYPECRFLVNYALF